MLDEQKVIGVWISEPGDNQAIARILVPTTQTESISDALSDSFGLHPEFRMMLFSVEATLPLPRESVESQDEQNIKEQAKGSQEQEQGEEQEQKQREEELQRISREELYQDIAQGAQISRVYLVTVVLSTVVAAVGLLRDDVAVIIGAMVIAPLLGPNVALALASTLGDLWLARRSIITLLAGVATAWVLALLIGMFGTVDPQVPSIAARTQVSAGDILLALAAGSAGALAYTTGIAASVIGVMVAVALLPPLVVVGLLVGAGYGNMALNALLLFVANIACVNLAGVVTFLSQKIRPRLWWESRNAGWATIIAMIIWVTTLALLLAIILLTGQVE
jgi:uncharacterized hydrophobic protein (TIGR00341 family)